MSFGQAERGGRDSGRALPVLSLKTAGALPVTAEEAAFHARVDNIDAERADIEAKLATAVGDRKTFTARSFCEETWEWWWAGWPACGYFEIPRPPLVDIVSIVYLDPAGNPQTWAASEYTVVKPQGPHAQKGRVVLNFGKTFPPLATSPLAVKLEFKAGYGAAAAVPSELKSAILLVFGELYAKREEGTTGTIQSKNFKAADDLCWPFRVDLA